MLFHVLPQDRHFVLLGDGMAAVDAADEPKLTRREVYRAAKYFIDSMGDSTQVRIADLRYNRTLTFSRIDGRNNIHLITAVTDGNC